ncbi:hypothetical protein MtrunA17_Chr8g0363081 [Medicago truncatula]|uniref:Uncharacterized protein n=1 Tax=Medicago truncatula TaxID=3880 RepID=A0A396GLV9_MEDTR|nr:hypothetical protein MtrunA17_Chr8g0363081 [Medicago truncatula]
MIHVRTYIVLLSGEQRSLILTSLAVTMRVVLNVRDLGNQMVLAIDVDVERMLRFRLQILGVIADTLRKTMQEIGEDDPIIYPKHLDNLLNLQLALHM